MRKKVFYTILILTVAALGSYFLILPDLIRWRVTRTLPQKLQFQEKTISLGDTKITYFESGENSLGPTLLFVHGFQADKSFWFAYLERLQASYHVLAIDLPGHGGSSLFPKDPATIYSFAKTLKSFVDAKGLDEFHLLGHSTGGAVATIFTHDHPKEVKSLVLFSPLGVQQNEKSELEKRTTKHFHPLFPKNIEEFDVFVTLLRGKPLSLPSWEKWLVLQELLRNRSNFIKIYTNFFLIEPIDRLLPKIHTPVLLIYGGHDQIIPPSSYNEFERLLPNLEVKKFPDGEHVFNKRELDEALLQVESFILSKEDNP